MKFYIEEVLVAFPYDYIYPEQLEYMTALKRGLDRKGHLVLEMPSGTGKTISLLSLLVAYINHHRDEKIKIVYCTRTVVEMTKTVEELRRLVAFWKNQELELKPITAVCLTARKNLCIHEEVSSLTYTQEVDAACRSMTAQWATEKRCAYYSNLMGEGIIDPSGDIEDGGVGGSTHRSNTAVGTLPPGIYSLDDLRKYGKSSTQCPYFLARHALEECDIIVQSYLYMVDPKVAPAVRKHLNKNTVVVMDEGHNVDDVCIEAMSMVITKADAQRARDVNMKALREKVEEVKINNREKLQNEYNALVNGLALANAVNPDRQTQLPAQNDQQRQLSLEVANEALPGNIRQASHFLNFLGRIIDFVWKTLARMTHPQSADPLTFLTRLKEECAIDIRHLRFTAERLSVLLSTLEIRDEYNFRHVSLIADMVVLLATFYKDDRYAQPGFVVVCEPYDAMDPNHIPDPILRLACVDASLAVREVFDSYNSVVLTSGTLSPLDIYPKILGFSPTVAQSFRMTLSRRCICPSIVTRSADQANIMDEGLTSSFSVRTDAAAQAQVTKAYSHLLLNLAQTVPDGIVCFFTGYEYMSEVMLQWNKSGFLKELSKHKLIFIETQGVEETSRALGNYRRACDIGRGAIFISIARGKIAEGIDFDRHYGRAVVMFGVPFLPPTDRSLNERLKWMENCLSIRESEFRNFDAMRQAAQCIGRVLRNKTDYGMMLLVDRRFALNDKRKKLPQWIQQCFSDNTNLSTDGAVSVARRFFVEMAQPWDRDADLGNTLLDNAALALRGNDKPSSPSFSREDEKEAEGDVVIEETTQQADTVRLKAVSEGGRSGVRPKGKRTIAQKRPREE